MRRTALTALALLIAVHALAQSSPYIIDNFDAQIVLQTDATIQVTETIAVTFNEPRRGIFRTIPVVYDAGRGRERAIQFELQAVTDGTSEQTTLVTREGDYVKIRIGDADVTLPSGTRKTYVISYSVFGALNWHDDGTWQPWAELYWNVTGDQWDTSIRETHFRVTFPNSPSDKVRGEVYAGGYGSRDSALVEKVGQTGDDNPARTALRLSETDFEGARVEPLDAYQGLTFVLGVPQAVVPKPSPWEELKRRLSEYLALFTPLVVAPIMALWWSRKGRDARDGGVNVHFEPPEGPLPPAETGALLDERVDQRDIAAGIMSLCVKGYLTIEVTDEGGFLKKREYALLTTDKKETSGLSKFESALYNRITLGGDFVTSRDLSETVAPAIADLKNDIYQELVNRGYYPSNPNMVRAAAITVGILLTGAVAFLLLQVSLISEPITAVIGGALAVVPAVFFGWHMPKRTYPGTIARRQALGFYEMMRYRKNYMAWVVDKQPDGLKYEEYLPYAVAFDLIDQWNDAFRDIVKEPPTWYHNPYGGAFNVAYFASDLRSMSSSMGQAAGTPPRSSGASGGGSGFSSGGGGGGFSGGGFGGGGGGSW